MRPKEPLNLVLRLQGRETYGHRQGAAISTQRSFYECVYPDRSALQVDPPDGAQLSRFTPDGKHLVCFGGPGMQQLVVFNYTGYSHSSSRSSSSSNSNSNSAGRSVTAAGHDERPAAVNFNSFFSPRYRVAVASGQEALCKDFCMFLHQGTYLLLASQTPQVDASRLQRELPPGLVDNIPVAQSTTFHVVRLRDGRVCSRRSFADDFIHLHHNAGASLYGDLMAVLSIRYQVIHLMQVLPDGDLLDVHHIGRHCSPDDELAISLAEQAELRWRQQQQERRLPDEGSSAAAAAAAQTAAHNPAAFGPDQTPPRSSTGATAAQQQHHFHPSPQLPPALHEAGQGPQEAVQLIEGLTQRMLAYSFKSAMAKQATDPAAARTELQNLYRNFDSLQQLTVWKVQLLDMQHLLLNLGPPLAPGEQQQQQQQQQASQQCQFFMVYNFHSTKVLALYRNSSEALLQLLLRHHALFQLDPTAAPWDQCAVRSVHSPQACEALLQQLASKADRAERAAFVRRVLAGLPCVSQVLMASPYLDPGMFMYDDKHISAVIRPRSAFDHPLKFVLRCRPERVAFKLLPPAKEQAAAGGRTVRRLVLQLFHPVEPLVISVCQAFMRPTTLNIYYRG